MADALNGGFRYFRLLPNGALDSSFTFDPATPPFQEATALPDGKLALSAGTDAQSTIYAALSRLGTNGSPDNTFQLPAAIHEGQVFRDPGTGDLIGMCAGGRVLALQPDGKILFLYLVFDHPLVDALFHLVRLNPDGSFDGSFAAMTFVPRDLAQTFPVVFDPVRQQTLQPPEGVFVASFPFLDARILSDGRILLAGKFDSFNGTPAHGLVRLQANGTVDDTFAIGQGAQWTTLLGSPGDLPAVEGLHVLWNGDLLVVGDFQAFDGTPAPGITLLHSSGVVDPNFIPPVRRLEERYGSAKLSSQLDGSLLLSGPYRIAGETAPRSLIRLLDGSIPSVVSRRIHGGAGTFDISLPLTGGRGIECRGTSGSYSVIFKFSNPISGVGAATVTSGVGLVTSNFVGADPHEYVVNLQGVASQQNITISLSSVVDTAGHVIAASVPVTMGVLPGDTNGDGFVNAGDSLQTRNRSGQASTNANFRSDVNIDGFINSGDTTVVRNRSGNFVP